MPAQMGEGGSQIVAIAEDRQGLPDFPSGKGLLPSMWSALSSIQLSTLSGLPQRQGVACLA